MDRAQSILRFFTKEMRLIEIGPSYNPLAPKRDGWNTTIIDHASKEELQAKYHDVTPENIEDVDYIWQGEPLDELVPEREFDGLILSHVGEHLPDWIGFLHAAAKLLKPEGIIALALPDLRLCFDFFRPRSTTGEIIAADGRTRHRLSTFFDDWAYHTERDKHGGWSRGIAIDQLGFELPHSLSDAYRRFRDISAMPKNAGYADNHGWCFTPRSFELIILELNLLGLSPWAISHIEPADGIEFYVWLKQETLLLTEQQQNAKRMQLMQEMIKEAGEQIVQLSPAPKPTRVHPTIAAIIPLYNGGRYIETSLRSVMAQTLPPDEVIVVDDGSTDSGPAIVRDLIVREFPNVQLLHKENGGQSSARNFGVRSSKAELIALLDQDDAWYPQHLEVLVKPFITPPIGPQLGWVYSNLDEANGHGQLIRRKFLSMLPAPHPKTDLMPCLNGDMFILPSAALISRDAFEMVGGFDEQLSGYEDDDLFLRMFRMGFQNVFIDESLSKWCIHHESSSYSSRMRKSRVLYSRKLLHDYPDDIKRNQHYTKHLIAPRFYRHAYAEFRDALVSGEPERIAETKAELQFWLPWMPPRVQVAGRALLGFRNQAMFKLAIRAKPVIRPIARRLGI